MAWRQYEEVEQDLKTANEKVSQLRLQLAQCHEQLKVATAGGPNIDAIRLQQVFELQNELQEAKGANHRNAKQLKDAENQFETALIKHGKTEQRLQNEIQALEDKLAGQKELLRVAQAARASDQAASAREKDLKDQVAKLKIENATLKCSIASLSKQFEVEKAGNRLANMRSNPNKGFSRQDQDDEEELPG